MSLLLRLSRRLAHHVDERSDSDDVQERLEELTEGARRVEYALLFAYPGGLLAAWWDGYPDRAILASAAAGLVWIVLYLATRRAHSLRKK